VPGTVVRCISPDVLCRSRPVAAVLPLEHGERTRVRRALRKGRAWSEPAYSSGFVRLSGFCRFAHCAEKVIEIRTARRGYARLGFFFFRGREIEVESERGKFRRFRRLANASKRSIRQLRVAVNRAFLQFPSNSSLV